MINFLKVYGTINKMDFLDRFAKDYNDKVFDRFKQMLFLIPIRKDFFEQAKEKIINEIKRYNEDDDFNVIPVVYKSFPDTIIIPFISKWGNFMRITDQYTIMNGLNYYIIHLSEEDYMNLTKLTVFNNMWFSGLIKIEHNVTIEEIGIYDNVFLSIDMKNANIFYSMLEFLINSLYIWGDNLLQEREAHELHSEPGEEILEEGQIVDCGDNNDNKCMSR
jgi:hypothetical protein